MKRWIGKKGRGVLSKDHLPWVKDCLVTSDRDHSTILDGQVNPVGVVIVSAHERLPVTSCDAVGKSIALNVRDRNILFDAYNVSSHFAATLFLFGHWG